MPGTTSSDNYTPDHSVDDGRSCKNWIIVIRCFTACRILCSESCSLRWMPPHDWSLACDAVITSSCRYSTGCPSESVLSSKWHAWFASRCSDSRLSTWRMIAASCLTVLGAVYGQLTSRLAWYREHSYSSYGDRTFAAAGPRLWNSLPVQLLNPDVTYGLFRRQLKGHLFGNHAWTQRSVTSDM